MTITVDLTADEEQRLAEAATRNGVAPAELAHRVLVANLPPVLTATGFDDPTLALFAQWAEEDAHMTDEEIAEERRDFEEFKKYMNSERARSGSRPLY